MPALAGDWPSSVRSEIFVATRATPFPSPVPPSFDFGAAGGAAYSSVAAVCDHASFITFLSSVIDRRYKNGMTRRRFQISFGAHRAPLQCAHELGRA